MPRGHVNQLGSLGSGDDVHVQYRLEPIPLLGPAWGFLGLSAWAWPGPTSTTHTHTHTQKGEEGWGTEQTAKMTAVGILALHVDFGNIQ